MKAWKNMCAKNVVLPPMILSANLKLNLRMNTRSGVHSPQNLTKKHISLSLKTIDKDRKPAGATLFWGLFRVRNVSLQVIVRKLVRLIRADAEKWLFASIVGCIGIMSRSSGRSCQLGCVRTNLFKKQPAFIITSPRGFECVVYSSLMFFYPVSQGECTEEISSW